MAVVLNLPELTYDHDPRFDDQAFLAELNAGRLQFAVSWRELLAMAVRDGAASVHFHPWRSNAPCDDVLTYVVNGAVYGLLPPDAQSVRTLLADARRLAAQGPVARLWAWVTGGAIGRLRLISASGESEWCVVCWGRGPLAGVEFLRISPAPVVAAMGNSKAPQEL